MTYTYAVDVERELLESYRTDADPFLTDDSRTFPERAHLRAEIDLLKKLFFPRYWNGGAIDDPDAVRDRLESLGSIFATGIAAYSAADAGDTVDAALEDLPIIRQRLKRDVEAAYKGDPAAKSYTEIIRSYPGFHAMLVYRVAHSLYDRGAPEYARELTEHAKTMTGIDIHPGAQIGEYFFIDHGTGVVIGETATVGDWTRIYQNVTLGALHFEEEEDEEHMLAKDYKRHPDIGSNVVIGAGSNVLGPVTVGDHVSIGANSWITDDVPPRTSVFIADHPEHKRKPKE